MNNFSLKKWIPFLIHILGWGLFGTVIFLLSPLSAGVERPIEFWIKQALMFSFLVSAFYANYFYFVPNLLFKNRISLFLMLNLLGAVAYAFVFLLYDDWVNMSELMHKAFRPDVPFRPRPRNYAYDFYNMLMFIMTVGIGTSIVTVQKWQEDEKLRLELDQQRINSELSYLKAQINPHFFFNTLNNIYALANIDIEVAKTALLKLSRMMRYVLYETEKNHTILSKELDFINDFIELMKIRLTSKVHMDVNVPSNLGNGEIAPMMLLPFIENCFKHGVSSQSESDIIIKITKENGWLELYTQNTIFKSTENTPEGQASGIGLANTIRRLNLLYSGKYHLNIDKENPENQYRVQLKIQLS